MLHTVMSLSELFPDGNLPTLDGLCFYGNGPADVPSQQIMSTNPKDFLVGQNKKGE